jgi:hypothetical protein
MLVYQKVLWQPGVFFSRKLEMATEMKLLKLSTVRLGGTKIHANASRASKLKAGQIFTILCPTGC